MLFNVQRVKKMIEMDQKEQILHYHRVDGLSLREISRRVGLNRKTVTRYIREYEAQVSSDPEEGADMCLASRPKYPPRKVERSKLTDAVCAEIEYWLSENAKRRQTGMKKQCLKRQDIHRALIEKGFSISYSSVCKYIQQRKAEKRSKITRIHRADFPQMKYLEELKREELPLEGQMILPEVETLDFIKEGRSIVMYGNPGTGKTHTAIGLGIKACLEGYSVFFTSVPHLLTMIREAKTEKTLRNLEIKFERYDLVICDELGYDGFDKESAEMLFNHLSLRTGKKSTIITTNLPFTRWEEVLKDKVLCSALVDRLCHKSYLVNMTGTSYRIKETRKIINNCITNFLYLCSTQPKWYTFRLLSGILLRYHLRQTQQHQ